MGSLPPLLSFLLMIAAGWVHRHQLIVIEFLQAENRLLRDLSFPKIHRMRFSETVQLWGQPFVVVMQSSNFRNLDRKLPQTVDSDNWTLLAGFTP
jgi:hypothetical protein